MSISVRKAFQNVFSDKYNKVNILVYVALFFLIGCCSAYMMPDQSAMNFSAQPQMSPSYLFAFLIYIVLALIATGIYSVAVNNEYIEKEEVFPDILTDLGKIVIVGLKSVFGYMLSCILIMIPLSIVGGIIAAILGKINPIISVLFFVFIGFILLLIISGLWLIFLQNLKFSDFFKYKTAWQFVMNNFKSYAIWGLKILALSIIFGILIFCLGFVCGFSAAFTMTSPAQMSDAMMALSVLGSTLSAFLGIIGMDLTGQFLLEVKNKA